MSYTVVSCPECGEPMNIRSKRCKKCVAQLKGTPPSQIDTCPKCGGKKNKRSKTCKACQYTPAKVVRSPRVRQLEPTEEPSSKWVSEFVGFFFGDGHISLKAANRKTSISLRLMISQRADNRAILDDILRKLGGSVEDVKVSGGSKPLVRWWLTSNERCKTVLLWLASSEMPAKKRDEAQVALDYLEWRTTTSFHFSEEERKTALSFEIRIKDIRTFKEPG